MTAFWRRIFRTVDRPVITIDPRYEYIVGMLPGDPTGFDKNNRSHNGAPNVP